MIPIIEKAKNFVGKKLDSQSKQLFKNSSWVLIANAFGFVNAFILSIVLARKLGVEVFGAYTLVINFVSATLEIFNLNVGTAIIKFGAAYKSENRIDKLVALVKGCAWASFVAFGLAIVVMVILLNFFYASFFSKPGMEFYSYMYAAALAIFLFAGTLSNSLLRLFFKFKINSIVNMVMDGVELVLVITALYMFPDNFKIFFLAVIITKLLNGVIWLIAALWEIKGDVKDHVGASSKLLFEQRNEIRGFVFLNSLSGTLKTFINRGDILLLGAIGNNAMVAYYSIAKKLAYSILAVTDPLANAIFPQLSKLIADKNHSETLKMLRTTTKLFLIPSVIALAIIFVLKKWMIKLLFGAEYLPAASPFFFLMMAALMSSVFFWGLSMIQSLGMIKLRFVAYIIAILTGGTAAYFLIPVYGATGAALGALIANIVINGSFVFMSYKKLAHLKVLENDAVS